MAHHAEDLAYDDESMMSITGGLEQRRRACRKLPNGADLGQLSQWQMPSCSNCLWAPFES